MAKKLPVGYGYGAAAPEKGAPVYAKKRRRRAARILRKRAKGGYRAFVKDFLKKNPGSTIADAAKAWKKEGVA